MALATPFPASARRRPRTVADRAEPNRAEPIRLTRRGKAVVTLGVSLLGFALLQGTGALQAVASAADGGPATATIVVAPGESLWSIAERVAPGSDPRSTILMIEELNGLQPGDGVRAGQGLIVPR